MPKDTCTCNGIQMLVGLVLMAIGLFLVVQGFVYHSNTPEFGKAWYAIGWYFLGLLLLVAGKFYKLQSHAKCPVHKM
ncbi:MAG: hypothetical protein HYX24_03860 [Candidatus Aenigmarchaeota archaeon]|nr:hypothetical protein [Candidatus Aenigmarchaeota archaeon]